MNANLYCLSTEVIIPWTVRVSVNGFFLVIYLHGSTTVHSMHCVLSFAQINFYFVFIFCLYCLYFVCFILIIEDINIACSCVFFANIWNATITAAKNVCVSYVSYYYIVLHVAISKERDGVTIFNFTTKTCFFISY